jgi:hypothetical protein
LECGCAVPYEVPGTLRLFELVASLRSFYFFKAELLLEFFVRFTVQLDIRIDEVVERWTVLFRRSTKATITEIELCCREFGGNDRKLALARSSPLGTTS